MSVRDSTLCPDFLPKPGRKKIKSRLTVQKTIFWNYRKNKTHDNHFEVVLMYFCLWTCNKVLYQTVGGQFNENNPASASFSSCAQCCTDSVITCSATNTAANWARPRDRLGLSGLTSSDFSQKPRPTEITKKGSPYILYLLKVARPGTTCILCCWVAIWGQKKVLLLPVISVAPPPPHHQIFHYASKWTSWLSGLNVADDRDKGLAQDRRTRSCLKPEDWYINYGGAFVLLDFLS